MLKISFSPSAVKTKAALVLFVAQNAKLSAEAAKLDQTFGGAMARARSHVWPSMERRPENAQYCFGRSSPSQLRMKDCIRRPSPPASTIGQTLELLLILVSLFGPPSTAWARIDPGRTLPLWQ